MPFYDCMLLLRPHVSKEGLMDLVARVGKHVYRRNGVLTDIKSFGVVQLGYGIKKLDGKQFKGQLMQIKHDYHTQLQQGAALLEQRRPVAALASG